MTAPWIGFLLCSLLGCDLDAANTVTDAPGDSGLPGTQEQPRDDTGDTGSDTTADPFDRDDDGDGWSENQGDCDDADPALHPDQDDECDGVDNDCDGELEEDARGDDIYEPNDEPAEWFYLGSLADSGSFSVTGYLHNDHDVDRFSVYAEDPWYSSFGIEVSLTNVPADANYRLHLGRVGDDGELEDSQSVYGGGSLTLSEEGEGGVDDAGTYGILIESWGGADCGQAYLLTVSEG